MKIQGADIINGQILQNTKTLSVLNLIQGFVGHNQKELMWNTGQVHDWEDLNLWEENMEYPSQVWEDSL